MATSREIRQQFLDFFTERCGHTVVASSPVVPHDDPTLLFTNAGMNQFKDVFLGTGSRPYVRAVDTQKCIRAGGKHNDLEDVGRDTYHHTFFEMLGNWSFGDYFKAEAIVWAWQLFTEVWGLPADRLYATVFEGNEAEGVPADDEAAKLWSQFLPPERISRWSKKDNFWEMGETGPCGPCSEIHIDLTPDGSGRAFVNRDDPRVIELWNLVFIQYNRQTSGELVPLPARHVDTGLGLERVVRVLQGKESNYDTDLFTTLFDAIAEVTGARPYAGNPAVTLEDKVDTAYRVIADHIRCLTFALADGAVPSNEGRGYVLRRILRRAVRHGWQTLDTHEPFLFRLVPAVVELMGGAFPELKQKTEDVVGMIQEEEETFERTLDRGISLFTSFAGDALFRRFADEQSKKPRDEQIHVAVGGNFLPNVSLTGEIDTMDEFPLALTIEDRSKFSFDRPLGNTLRELEFGEIDKDVIASLVDEPPIITGRRAFLLHDTYGFPLDLTQVMADERGVAVDVDGFNELMEQARQKARAAGGSDQRDVAVIDIVQKQAFEPTQFLGYEQTHSRVKTFCMLFEVTDAGPQHVEQVQAGEHVAVVLGATPFYGEAGGQVGDAGVIENGEGGVLRVGDTKRVGDVIVHFADVEAGPWRSIPPDRKGDYLALHLRVDEARRSRIMANHTVTHMMNRALRLHVNKAVDQKGSLVDDEKTRFDFPHNAAVTTEQIEQVEQTVNADIAADMPVYFDFAPQEEALKINGLRAVFGERYPPRVRVVSIGVPVADLLADPHNAAWQSHSIEFCGGTHLARTGDAGQFVIASEEAVAKGVRRITALTGDAAKAAAAAGEALFGRLYPLHHAPADKLADELTALTDAMQQQTIPAVAAAKLRAGIAELQKIVKQQQKVAGKAAATAVTDVARQIADEASGDVIVSSVEAADGNALRTAMDVIRKKRPDAAMLLGAVANGKVSFVAAVPKPLIEKGLQAGDWVREVAKVTGGGGGGRPDMAQAGGKDPAKLDDALDAARAFAKEKMG